MFKNPQGKMSHINDTVAVERKCSCCSARDFQGGWVVQFEAQNVSLSESENSPMQWICTKLFNLKLRDLNIQAMQKPVKVESHLIKLLFPFMRKALMSLSTLKKHSVHISTYMLIMLIIRTYVMLIREKQSSLFWKSRHRLISNHLFEKSQKPGNEM